MGKIIVSEEELKDILYESILQESWFGVNKKEILNQAAKALGLTGGKENWDLIPAEIEEKNTEISNLKKDKDELKDKATAACSYISEIDGEISKYFPQTEGGAQGSTQGGTNEEADAGTTPTTPATPVPQAAQAPTIDDITVENIEAMGNGIMANLKQLTDTYKGINDIYDKFKFKTKTLDSISSTIKSLRDSNNSLKRQLAAANAQLTQAQQQRQTQEQQAQQQRQAQAQQTQQIQSQQAQQAQNHPEQTQWLQTSARTASQQAQNHPEQTQWLQTSARTASQQIQNQQAQQGGPTEYGRIHEGRNVREVKKLWKHLIEF